MSKKTLLYYIYVLILFASCEKDQDAMLTQLEVMKEQFTPSYTSISVECQLNSMASIKDVYVQYASSEGFADYQEIQMQKKDGKYHANIVDLEDNTIYYIRYSASNRYSNGTTKKISSIKTLVPSVPKIQILSITNVLDKSADVLFDLKFDGGASITQLGICWGTSNNPSIDSDSFVEAKDNKRMVSLSSLQENTTYYVRAYAVNKKGIGYSEQEISFTTLTLPVVQTNEVTDIQLTTALLNGNLIFNGNDTATILGFCWGETPQPTISNNQKQVTTSSNNFAYQLSNLKDETKYYVRAYAKNKIGVSYGEEKSFTTTSAIKPTLTTASATNISYTSATVGGNVTSDGGATITERGVVYSTTQSPTTSNSKVTSGNGTGSFTCDLTNLQENTKYYVRAYATNKKGTSYGPQSSFTTKAYALPTLTTSSATNISYTSVTIGGNVINDGGTSVTERGVVYSTNQNPTTSDSKVTSGNGIGSFTCNITNLQENTKYYVRAYAINKKGTSYGPQSSFTTKAYSLPIVTTSSATNISYTSATVGGNVTSDGGANVTERGVVYSTNQNPTTSNNKVTSGNGAGSFSCSLINLQEGTTYYIRAYAINKKGICYGENIIFNTLYHPYFSVDAISKIVFAPGNLQYNRTTQKWLFASEQYEIIGKDNFIDGRLANVIDVFSWSCSSTDFGVSICGNTSEYTEYFRDWGRNAIGEFPAYTWRTLSKNEWLYLIKRTNDNSEALYGIAEVNGVGGIILLPDNWVPPTDVSFKTGKHTERGMDSYGDYQKINIDDWKILESLGAVFLPATGSNGYNYVGLLYYAEYWSSTCSYQINYYDKEILTSCTFSFCSDNVGVGCGGSIFDRGAVRLVKDL